MESNNSEIFNEIIKEIQNEILSNINKKFKENFKLFNEIKFLLWKPSDIERKIIRNAIDFSDFIDKYNLQIYKNINKISEKKKEINSFDSLIIELKNLRIKHEDLKNKKNNKLVNLCISIIYQRNYDWIQKWKKYDENKISKLDCEQLKKYENAILDYVQKEYEIIFDFWQKLKIIWQSKIYTVNYLFSKY